MQWTSSVKSEDTTKTAKDTWSEGKGCVQRLQAATPCVLRGTSIPGLLLCLGTNHRALHRQTDLMVTQRHRNCPVQQLGFFGGSRAWPKVRDFMGRMPRQGFAGLSGGPTWNHLLSALPFPHYQIRCFQAGCISLCRFFRLASTTKNGKSPKGGQFYFRPIRDELFWFRKYIFLLSKKRKKEKKNLQTFLWADKLIILDLSLAFRVCPGHSGYFCLLGLRGFLGCGAFSAKMETILAHRTVGHLSYAFTLVGNQVNSVVFLNEKLMLLFITHPQESIS